MTDSLRVGIAGLGTVGVGVYKIIEEKFSLLSKRTGTDITVSAVSSRNKDKDRGIALDNIAWETDAVALAKRDDVDVVIELIGGEDGIALDVVKTALENKKHVVTANKALIAKHGEMLAKLAEDNGVSLCFEAAVAGGIPILKALREGLAANEYTKIAGIMNGTCNYILSVMESEGRDYADVLKDAQDLGYAETPPDLDVDGIDAAHKLCIITALAYGVAPDFDAIFTEGIREVSGSDIQFADELGYRIRLLGVTEKTEDGIEQRVHPCLVSHDSAMARIVGPQNAILAECDSLGPALLTGAGAGEGPTASSVMADVIDIARGYNPPAFGVDASTLTQARFKTIDTHKGNYYVRIKVKDLPGVLADITSALSAESISVDQVIQKQNGDENAVYVALTTHQTVESSAQNAVKSLSSKDYVLEQPHLIRIENI